MTSGALTVKEPAPLGGVGFDVDVDGEVDVGDVDCMGDVDCTGDVDEEVDEEVVGVVGQLE